MGLRISTFLAATGAAAFLAVPSAGAATGPQKPPLTWLKGEGNYTKAHRSPSAIDCIVVHVTEGSFWGSVQWLQNEHAHASAHYIVARSGKIIQLVHTSDIAWHAGNWKLNRESVGIEHEGFTYGPNGFTAAQYESSARLAAWLARRSLLPIDRKHIIGHSRVPAPGGGFGGSGHHTDPGPRWNWNRYLTLVRAYAKVGPTLSVETELPGTSLTGIVPWRARVEGGVRSVEFVVDGEVVWTDRRAPFAFGGGRGLNTVPLGNGRHVLELRAYGDGTRHDITRRTIQVANRAFSLTTAGARPWTKVKGTLNLRARVWNAKAAHVTFRLDGKARSVDRRAPYGLRLGTTRLRDGKHVLEVVARAVDGRVASRRIPVVVSNRAVAPKRRVAPPVPALVRIISQSLTAGQTVSGLVVWRVETAGKTVRVEFLVDGALVGADVAAPYTFGWHSDAETPGPHVLTALAVGSDGKRVEASVTVMAAGAPASAGSAGP